MGVALFGVRLGKGNQLPALLLLLLGATSTIALGMLQSQTFFYTDTGKMGGGLVMIFAHTFINSFTGATFPVEVLLADAPEWFLRLLREAQKSRANGSATIGVAIPEGRRNDTLTSLAGTMRRRGMGFEEIEAALLVTNNKRCDPPLAEDEVRKVASSVCRYRPVGEAAFR